MQKIVWRGLLWRIRSRLILMRHPNYRRFKQHLRNVWTGE